MSAVWPAGLRAVTKATASALRWRPKHLEGRAALTQALIGLLLLALLAAVPLWTSAATGTAQTTAQTATRSTSASTPATTLALVTIRDGEATLLRGTERYALDEGVALQADDIVETPASGKLLRIEFSEDGALADLGPGSRVLLSPRYTGERSRTRWRLHLLQGVLKLSLPVPRRPGEAAGSVSSASSSPTEPSADFRYSSPTMDLLALERSAVFALAPGEAAAFAESGALRLQPRSAGTAAGEPVALRAGEFWSRDGSQPALRSARPSPAFVQRLPRAFLDTLPARAARFQGREVALRPLGRPSYDELAAWIDAEGLRAGFVPRWKTLAADPAFRRGLEANLRLHPEWDRLLHPEKYRPKPLAVPGTASSAVVSPGTGRPAGAKP